MNTWAIEAMKELSGQVSPPPVYNGYETVPWDQATHAQRQTGIRVLNLYHQSSGKCPDCSQGKLNELQKHGSGIVVGCSSCGNQFTAEYEDRKLRLTWRFREDLGSTWKPAPYRKL